VPIDSGLLIHLDAFAISDQPAQESLPINSWTNWGSLSQALTTAAEKSAPKRFKVGQGWVVRFDGEDDALRLVDSGMKADQVTLFIVAAPHSNAGDFRGLLSANAAGQRDYESGINVDLGPGPTQQFEQLNVEGRGFGGASNLRKQASPLGQLQVIELHLDRERATISLQIDGQAEGSRSLKPGSLAWDQLTIGARHYKHAAADQALRGYFHGDIAAVLIYDRVLNAEQSARVRDYLAKRYLALNDALKATLPAQLHRGVPLVKVASPPLVQMLVPGFEVQELPVELTNLNNVRYRRDGRLVTLGYNGDLHLLSDSDGDGLEDSAELYWKNQGSIRGPIGMVLTPADYPQGQGVIIASKGKISMIVDRDGDDRGDEEVLVASGWEEIPQNVDAVGLAMDQQGNLYFGLGTANYANAYLLDEKGQAKYDLNSDRGTVQRVAADWSKRETVCTGIRFPIAFEFNQQGDLFCTEQEGATWLANGNPLDELLHIPLDGQAPSSNPHDKRHFGFPPRHPRHNPSVIDEPSVYDYGPQHQSTCGMCFNLELSAGNLFGPQWWRNDALVCGESRGKLWRTKLVKTEHGYIADSQLIACLQMLTVDACTSPRGDLVIACHSGPPDWGTGPQGPGKLFRVSMRQPQVPRPIASWMASPSEFVITFDQPLDPNLVRGLVPLAKIQFGQHVRAGDRFENLIPPYAVVQQQRLQPRFELPLHSVALSPDSKTLTLHTDSTPQPVHHSITLPLGATELDLDTRPTGVQATWTSSGASKPEWQGYLPHLDLDVCRQLLGDSAFHQPLWPSLEREGVLELSTLLDCRSLLRPAVQAGAVLDHQWPAEVVTIHLSGISAATVISATSRSGNEFASVIDQAQQKATITLPAGESWVKLQLKQPTSAQQFPRMRISYSTLEDSTGRAFPLHRWMQPWAPVDAPSDQINSSNSRDSIAELSGGSWGRGRQLFRDQRTLCSRCHAINGEGSKIGPDLGNLVFRDYASVLRDIVEPSRAINPDYLTHTLSLVDGQILTGVVSSDNQQLVVADAQGETRRVQPADVEQMKATDKSVMPDGLMDKLSDMERRDLLTYLLTPPPTMPMDSPLQAPPVRTRAEVAAVLQGSQVPEQFKPLNLVLVDGVKDHGPGEHDYPAWQRAWAELLHGGQQLTISTAREFPSDEQLAKADVVIFFQKGSFSLQRSLALDKFLGRGGGAVFIHWAVNGDDRVREFAKRIGFASHGGNIKYRHGPLTLDMVNTDHPILRNIDRLSLYDESYWLLTGDPAEVTVLATSKEDGKATPQIWLRDHNPGRVFVSIPGHYSWTFDDPIFRALLLRGIAWTANEPVDRFNELVTPGARIK
jgi:putative heme-binding domain-containing protein